MTNCAKNLRRQAENLYWGRSNNDNPICPICKVPTEYYGAEERKLGEGEWECPVCGYHLAEDELRRL